MNNRYGRLKIISKIWIFIVIFIVIISLSLIVLESTLHTTYELVKEVADTRLNELTATSKKTRQLAAISSDINRLKRTYSISNSLDEEGRQISEDLSLITEDIDNQLLSEKLESYSSAFDRFLIYAKNLRQLQGDFQLLFISAEEEITLLENLISSWMIESALQGTDIDYYDQLLSLITGYRESFLIIDKKTTEYITASDPDNYESSDLYNELYSLHLRLQTITASMPEVAVHGRKLAQYVQQYKNRVKALKKELTSLLSVLQQLADSESSLHQLVSQREREAALSAEQIKDEIDLLFTDVLARMGMFMLIMVLMIIGTMYYMLRLHIEKPLKTLTGVVSDIGADHLDKAIILGRDDEWKIIENALNEMSKKLAKSYAELQVSQASYQALVNNVPGIVYSCQNDSNRTMEYLSDEFCDLTGYDTSEVLNNREISYSELIHPDDRREVEINVNEA
ncbi:MAG: hypothetical protein AB2700_15675, partial [Candidatus Thiodiazotropha taylori]